MRRSVLLNSSQSQSGAKREHAAHRGKPSVLFSWSNFTAQFWSNRCYSSIHVNLFSRSHCLRLIIASSSSEAFKGSLEQLLPGFFTSLMQIKKNKNKTKWQRCMFCRQQIGSVGFQSILFFHVIQFLSHPRITPKRPNPSACDDASLGGFKHCTHSSMIFLWTPTGCCSGHVYSEQSFSAVFLSAVHTHCDGLLPVASYPVLQTQTSPQLIREFIVNSREGHPVPLFLTPSPSLSHCFWLGRIHTHWHNTSSP